jgi:hypothetical protein
VSALTSTHPHEAAKPNRDEDAVNEFLDRAEARIVLGENLRSDEKNNPAVALVRYLACAVADTHLPSASLRVPYFMA